MPDKQGKHRLRSTQVKSHPAPIKIFRSQTAVARRLLEKQGYQVVVAGNGREALLALDPIGGNGFDLILMDVQMPEVDGFQATVAIRARVCFDIKQLQVLHWFTSLEDARQAIDAWRRE